MPFLQLLFRIFLAGLASLAVLFFAQDEAAAPNLPPLEESVMSEPVAPLVPKTPATTEASGDRFVPRISFSPPPFAIPSPRDFISPLGTAITTSTVSVINAPLPPRTYVVLPTSTPLQATSTKTSTDKAATPAAVPHTGAPADSLSPNNVVYSGGSGIQPSNSAPVITLSGSASVSMNVGSLYTDPGASANDAQDGNITSRIVVGGDAVNPDLAGTYHITYNVTDSKGLAAAQVTRTVMVNPPASIPTSAQQPSFTLAPAGQDVVLNVSDGSAADPAFSSVDINPLHVYVGGIQTFTVHVSSASGVKSVDAVTQLDTVAHTMHLTKTDDNGTAATFTGSWTVYDTHTEIYRTQFTATSNSGSTNSTTMAWSDPCTGITQGTDSTLSANCAVSTVYGLDGGNLTIPANVTLTLNAGTTWAWNPGTSVTVNGKIVKVSGAQMKKGYLFYSGSTNDSANTAAFAFDASATKSGYVRAGTWFSFTPINNVLPGTAQISNTVAIGGIANGTPVTLSDSGNGETALQMSINGGAWVSSGTINSGQTLAIKFRTGPDYLWTYGVTAAVGGASSTFYVTTKSDSGGCGDIPCP